MALSTKQIAELKEILYHISGTDFDSSLVAQIGEDLVGFFDVLAKIYHNDREEIEKDLLHLQQHPP